MMLNFAFAEIEVIKINADISEISKKYYLTSFKNGGIVIDKDNIYIPDNNIIFIQSRKNKNENTRVEITIHGESTFHIYKLLISKEKYVMLSLFPDGQFYLHSSKRNSNEELGLISKHGGLGRIIELKNGDILVSGIYRPMYSRYLKKYDNNSMSGLSLEAKRKFDELFKEHEAFSITVYNQELVIIDSANTIKRHGENAREFEGLFLDEPLDVSESGEIYLIDSDQGYVIEKYTSDYDHKEDIKIENQEFTPIPRNLTEDKARETREKKNTYSQVNALYIKGQYMITSFNRAPNMREAPRPPYYYDITNLTGRSVIQSGELDYPIICEDDGEKVFLFVFRNGGWLGEDEMYLVGLSVEDILAGKAEKETIDRAILRYKKRQSF